jgi:hypothetical protein
MQERVVLAYLVDLILQTFEKLINALWRCQVNGNSKKLNIRIFLLQVAFGRCKGSLTATAQNDDLCISFCEGLDDANADTTSTAGDENRLSGEGKFRFGRIL